MIPQSGTASTKVWYWQYHNVVAWLPKCGSQSTTMGYWRYQNAVARRYASDSWVERVGEPHVKAEGGTSGEVDDVLIVLKGQAVVVAITGEETQNPLLLLGGQHPLATMVAIVGAVTAEIVLDGIAQGCAVLLLHFLEKGRETVGGTDDAHLLEVSAGAVLVGRGEDGIAPRQIVGQMLAGQEVEAFAVLRTLVTEAEVPRCRHLAEVKSYVDILFHAFYITNGYHTALQ